jgi:hypothetical protein
MVAHFLFLEGKMKYYRELLQTHSLHDLRSLGREIGVRAPSKFTKSELIEEILLVDEGKKKPYFTKRGRPDKDGRRVKEENLRREQIEKLIDEELIKLKKLVLSLI